MDYSVNYLFYGLAGIIGLCVGSFLNSVIYRLPIMISEAGHQLGATQTLSRPRSYCFHCQTQLPIWANIPVISYTLLKGRASCCGGKIPWRYPSVELLCAIICVLLAKQFSITPHFFCSLLLSWSLISLGFIDLDTFMLPDQITLPMTWLGLLCNTFSVFTPLNHAVLGAIVGFSFFYFMGHLFSRVRARPVLGGGDLKMMAMLGAWLGLACLPTIILIASLTGLVIGLGYLLINRKPLTTPIPFGPFLSLSGLVVLLCQPKVM